MPNQKNSKNTQQKVLTEFAQRLAHKDKPIGSDLVKPSVKSESDKQSQKEIKFEQGGS